MGMPVARLCSIADRLHIPKEQVVKWRDEEDWLFLRAQRQQTELAKVLRELGDPRLPAVKLWKLMHQTLDLMKVLLKKQPTLETIKTIVLIAPQYVRTLESETALSRLLESRITGKIIPVK